MTERIIGQRGQADHCVIAHQARGFGIADVTGPAIDCGPWRRAEVTPLVETEVEPVDLVSCGLQKRHHDGPDVTTVTSYQDLHALPPR